jgi:tetratricopeptide (TPR) repeat protein
MRMMTRRLALLLLLSVALLLPIGAAPGRADTVDDMRQAAADYYAGQYQKAVELYSKAIASNDLNGTRLATAYRGRGEANLKIQDYDAAIQDFSLAIGLDNGPDNLTDCYHGRAQAYEATEQRDQAIDDWRRLAFVDPNNSEARRALVRLGEKPGILP